MRRQHYHRLAPHCPICARDHGRASPLVLGPVAAERGDDVLAATLVCEAADCRAEYPVIDGVPLILPDVRRLLGERAIELLLRDDLPPETLSLLGDALGPDTWFDQMRQTVSTYAWDAWADLDPAEAKESAPQPGAASRCLRGLLDLLPGGVPPDARLILDLGCGAGRTSFDLAQAAPDALVVGMDVNLALLRLARCAGAGEVRYARRRIGLVYDERRFPVALPGAERVDFWACDVAALPLSPASADLVVGLNLLDCMADPAGFLHGAAALLRPGGGLLLATPFDWAARATSPPHWIGGHSQRGEGGGAAEPLLAALLTEGRHARSVPGLALAGTGDMHWQTRLHDRAAVTYRTHLTAAQKVAARALWTSEGDPI